MANPEFAANPDRYLAEARPPMLKDFLDERLCIRVDATPKVRRIKLTFGVEVMDIPQE